jgi:hypothetical protein
MINALCVGGAVALQQPWFAFYRLPKDTQSGWG